MSVPPRDHAAAIDVIYRVAAAPELWPETLSMLSDYVGASGGLLAYSAPVGGRSFAITARLRDDLVAQYNEHYAINPYSCAYARSPLGQFHVGNQIVDGRSVRRTAFHADILAPHGIEDQIGMGHASLTRNGSSGGIAFVLSARQVEDTRQVATRLDRLAPHLSRAVDLSLEFGRHRGGTWALERMLNAMQGAALLLDRNGVVIRTNVAADRLLQQRDGIAVVKAEGLRLTAELGAEARRLSACIAQALAVARGEDRGLDGSLRITRPSGRPPLLVVITPLPPLSFSLWEAVDGGARAMVQIVDLHAPVQAQAEKLRGAAGLTAAEARVAALIGGGCTAAEAASVLGLSLNTVKTHLSRCFDKTGARSQVALARLLASLPAQAARDQDP